MSLCTPQGLVASPSPSPIGETVSQFRNESTMSYSSPTLRFTPSEIRDATFDFGPNMILSPTALRISELRHSLRNGRGNCLIQSAPATFHSYPRPLAGEGRVRRRLPPVYFRRNARRIMPCRGGFQTRPYAEVFVLFVPKNNPRSSYSSINETVCGRFR